MKVFKVIVGLFIATVLFAANGSSVHAQSQNDQQAQNSQTEEAKNVVVNPGDTLSKIATAHQTTYPRLFDANTKIKDPDLIYPGDTLRIPRPDEVLESRAVVVSSPSPTVAATKPKQKNVAAQQKPKPQPAPTPTATTNNASVWDRLAQCESGGNWSINTGNGYYGGLQFSLASWKGVGGTGLPSQASKSEQIARGEKLQAKQGWGAWPACTRKLGIR